MHNANSKTGRASFDEDLLETGRIEDVTLDSPDERLFLTAYNLYRTMPDYMRDLYVRCSYLRRFDYRTISDLLGESFVSEVMERYSQNTFFERVYDDTNNQWYFTIENDFKKFLNTEVIRFEDTEWTQFKRNVCIYFIYHENYEALFSFYIDAEMLDEYENFLENIELERITSKNPLLLRRIAKELPKYIIEEYPCIQLVSQMVNMDGYQAVDIEQVEHIYKHYRGAGSKRMEALASACLIKSNFYAGRLSESLDDALDRAPELAEHKEIGLYSQAALLYAQGLWNILKGPSIRNGAELCQRSYWIAKTANSIEIECRSLGHMILALGYLGEYDLVDEWCARLSKLLINNPDALIEFKPLLYTSRAVAKYLVGDHDEAEYYLVLAQYEANEQGMLFANALAISYSMIGCRYDRDYDHADKNASFFQKLQGIDELRPVLCSFYTYYGQLKYHQGKYSEAERIMRTVHALSTSAVLYSNIYCYLNVIGWALVSMHDDHSKFSPSFLDDSIRYFSEMRSYRFLSEGYLVRGLLQARCGNRSQALDDFENGVGLLESLQEKRMFIISDDDLLVIMGCILSYESVPCPDYLIQILFELGESGKPLIKQVISHVNAEVRGRAYRNRFASISDGVQLDIKTMGELTISKRDGGVLHEEDWTRSQSKNLLKLIVARGSRNVPRDVLMDDIWPNRDSNSQKNNFKVTVHRLNMFLLSRFNMEMNSSYVITKDNKVSINAVLCNIDTLRYFDLYREAKKLDKEGNKIRAVLSYQQMIDICSGGEFLASDLYQEPIIQYRKKIKSALLNAYERLAFYFEEDGGIEQAIEYLELAMALSPYEERICMRLMPLYYEMGGIQRAAVFFRAFNVKLRNDLGVTPQQQTIELFEKLVKHGLSGS